MTTPKKAKHIGGIDGLRAISVLAVIAFHYFSGFESSGYLGVDVFFVISGFVITASIANYETPNSLKEFVVEFYLRRFKRLLPALLLVVTFTSILIMFVTTGGKDNIRTGALSLIGGANIFLYIKEADYFAPASELNPFTHMWSLAVEDQFYLIFPFLLWGCAFFVTKKSEKNNNTLLVIISQICIVSLAAFIALFDYDYSFSFYMMPTRLWQIGTGIIVYLFVSRSSSLAFLKQIPIVFPVLILLGILSFGHHEPLVAHIAVTLITALMLAILWYDQDRGNILSLKFPAYIGQISYSLYLWHWPFLVLAKHTIGTSSLVIMVCLIMTFIFSIASYHLVEKPLRHTKNINTFVDKEKIFQKALTGIIVCVLVLYVGISRYAPVKTNLLASAFGVPAVPDYAEHKCNGDKAYKKLEKPLMSCLGDKRTTEKPHKVYLLGDSHANQFVSIIDELLIPTQYQLQFINAASSDQGVSGLISKSDFIPLDFAYMLKDAKQKDVFILAFHRGRLNENRDIHVKLETSIEPNEPYKNFTSNLLPILSRLETKGVKKLLMYDTPMMALGTVAQSCAIQTQLSGDNLCRVSKTQDLHTRKRQEIAYAHFKKSIPSIKFWDPLESIYGSNTHHDVLDKDGDYIMHDMNHITEKLAMKLKPELEDIIKGLIANQ